MVALVNNVLELPLYLTLYEAQFDHQLSQVVTYFLDLSKKLHIFTTVPQQRPQNNTSQSIVTLFKHSACAVKDSFISG